MDFHMNENFRMDIHGGGFDSKIEPGRPAHQFKKSCANHRDGFESEIDPACPIDHSKKSCRPGIHLYENPF